MQTDSKFFEDALTRDGPPMSIISMSSSSLVSALAAVASNA